MAKRPPLFSPAQRQVLQFVFDAVVEQLSEWQQNDLIDPGQPLKIKLDLDVFFPNDRTCGTSIESDLTPPTPK